ncbi:MAG: WG repeat-containing protein [Eubacterium sp.]|nr:WG repeat-containing protein [Eubacterium sp.]
MKRRLAFIIMLGLLVVSAYIALFHRQKDSSAEYVKAAEGMAEKGFHMDAVRLYEKALELRKKDPQLSITIAREYIQAGDYQTAVDLLESLKRETGGDRDTYYWLAQGYYLDGKEIQAVQTIQEGKEKYKLNENIRGLYETLRAKYDSISDTGALLTDYFEGYAVVRDAQEQISLVDAKGRNCLKGVKNQQIESICDFTKRADGGEEDTKLFVTLKTDQGIISVDKDGYRRAVPEGDYEYVGCLRDGYMLVKDAWGWGYVNAALQDTGLRFEDATAFAEGIAAVKENGSWRFVTAEGLLSAAAGDAVRYDAVAYDAQRIASRAGGILALRDGSWRLYGADGKALSGVYDEVKAFVDGEGAAAVRSGNVWGLINAAGEEVLAPAYEELCSGGTTLIAFRQGSLWGYMDMSGDVYVEPTFAWAGYMDDGGRACVIPAGGSETGLRIEMYIFHKENGLLS